MRVRVCGARSTGVAHCYECGQYVYVSVSAAWRGPFVATPIWKPPERQIWTSAPWSEVYERALRGCEAGVRACMRGCTAHLISSSRSNRVSSSSGQQHANSGFDAALPIVAHVPLERTRHTQRVVRRGSNKASSGLKRGCPPPRPKVGCGLVVVGRFSRRVGRRFHVRAYHRVRRAQLPALNLASFCVSHATCRVITGRCWQ